MGDDVDHEWQPVKGRRRITTKETQQRIDIATATGRNNSDFENLTTFFFTNFPDSFGAKAMFNAFHYYGDIREVVIPAKRDKGGRRFGFARFDQVTDSRRFAIELDNLIIGRDKISVNLSRFNRPEGFRRYDDGRACRKERGIQRSFDDRKGEGNRYRPPSRYDHRTVSHHKNETSSYAQAVRRDIHDNKEDNTKRCVLSYDAAKDDMERLSRAFIGVVAHSGMSYNVQSAFHSQGCFGVKVTPLGSNLTLLEGQEEGEVQALMEEAKGWLDQWFVEIRPWSPNDIDIERNIWLRIYGIPTHAWNDLFFAQVVKPWGNYINADDGTSKKITMDVARLLIRTSCQKGVDDFIDVKINGEIFHLRVLEDSYGPMRIMVPISKGPDGRDPEGESEEEEEENRSIFMEEMEEEEDDQEREPDNSLALIPVVNANNDNSKFSGTVLEVNNSKEDGLSVTHDFVSNSIDSTGVASSNKGGSNKVDSKLVELEFRVGHEEGIGGPQNSNNINLSITGGVVRDGERKKGGVYSDGPRNVYNKLNKAGPVTTTLSCPTLQPLVSVSNHLKRVHPLPAKVRRQNHLIHSLHLRNSNLSLSSSPNRASSGDNEATSRRSSPVVAGLKRNPPYRSRVRAKPSESLSSAGEVLCCSSIDSSAIRNCNARFLDNHVRIAAKKVWEGALELGVSGEEEEGRYVE
jgi:hypothetical protein